MKSIKYLFSILFTSALLLGCYKDKGNYEYTPVNKLKDSVVTTLVARIPTKDSTIVEYLPLFTQTINKDESKLSFEWQKSNPTGQWISYSKVKTLKFSVKAGSLAERDFFRLITTDNSVGIKYYNDITINYVQPFVKCWFVLQDDNSKSLLGTVENMGPSALVSADAYGKENAGAVIDGKPRVLMVNGLYNSFTSTGSWPFASLYVFTDQGGKFYNAGNLTPVLNYTGFMRQYNGTPNPTKAYWYTSREAILDKGELWQQGGATRFYMAPLDGTLSILSHNFTGGAFIYNAMILFDELNKRFLYFNNAGNSYSSSNTNPENPTTENRTKITNIPVAGAYPNKFNPTAIGGDKTFLYGGMSYGLFNFEATALIATYSAIDANKLHVYEFSTNGIRSGTEASCSAYWPCNPSGISITSKLATSFAFKRILFYSSGNKIYKLDLNATPVNASVIYQHPDPTATVTAMRFRTEYNGFSDNGTINWLGIGVMRGTGVGSLVELHLKASGDLVPGETVQEYSGFKRIVDIAYNNK